MLPQSAAPGRTDGAFGVKGAGTIESPSPSPWAKWFGGSSFKPGARITPLQLYDDLETTSTESSADAILDQKRDAEKDHAIQYRTCSWRKTAALLFSEYICLAIMSFPWSYSVLGLVPGLILTVVVAGLVLYTSLILWQFCLRHPEVQDVCDIGQMLFWGKRWAWYGTAVMFLLNNTFIQALHVLVSAEYINTMVGPSTSVACRTVSFSAIAVVICWICSLPRTFKMLSKLGAVSAIFTFISVLLATIFAGVQSNPAGFDPQPTYPTPSGKVAVGGNPIVTAVPVAGTTFVAGLNAFLNISYTFIGQITLPSFIAEMENPKWVAAIFPWLDDNFPKALWACTIGEIIVFSVVGAVIYANTGNQYVTAPAFGSLVDPYKKISFSFMIPTLIFLGVLYSSVSARFIFFRLFRDAKRHIHEHTVVGWASWAGILLGTWILAFIIAEVIPFFSSLLSLMSSLFDCFFGFIFWAVAYFRMRQADRRRRERANPTFRFGDAFQVVLNAFIMLIGVFFLTVGTYASVMSIIEQYEAGTVKGVFSCESNGI